LRIIAGVEVVEKDYSAPEQVAWKHNMNTATKDIIVCYGVYIARYSPHSGDDDFISPVDLLDWLAKKPPSGQSRASTDAA
jgi:hypothetical protein